LKKPEGASQRPTGQGDGADEHEPEAARDLPGRLSVDGLDDLNEPRCANNAPALDSIERGHQRPRDTRYFNREAAGLVKIAPTAVLCGM
jgi:hypothetical protein